VLNLPFLMELGDFIFIQFIFLKLEDTWTFISNVGMLVSWKSEITKNFTRIASAMDLVLYPSSGQGASEYVPLILYL
jgi:hypothetical protein